MTHTNRNTPFTLTESVRIASSMVDDPEEISAVHIIGARAADARDFDRVMSGQATERDAELAFRSGEVIVTHRLVPTATSIRRAHHRPHLPMISLGFPNLAEGTR